MDKSATHRMYFAAIACGPELEAKIAQFKYRMRDLYHCLVALRSPAHITLVPPFWLDEREEPKLLKGLQEFRTTIGEMQINLDGFDHFGRRVLFVKVDRNPKLEEIRDQLTDHFMAILPGVIKREERPFHPHITIANRDMRPGDFLKAWEYFSQKQFKEEFTTNTISLFKLGPEKWIEIVQQSW